MRWSQCASAAGFRARRRQVLGRSGVIVWRCAFDMGGDVAAFAADSGSSLRVTGRRESARYKSLSFEFSAQRPKDLHSRSTSAGRSAPG